MSNELQVGIIGAKADRGWAREAHVPAIQATDGLALTAVATRDRASAEAAAQAFGVARAFGDAAGLVALDDLDVVVVAASVPAHRELVLAALGAGKHVVTEWPVTTSTTETEELAAAARTAGRRVVVGLQARANPAAARALELVRGGAVGRVLTASVLSTTAGFGQVVPEGERYLEDPATGMHLATIQAAHTLDLATLLAGPLTALHAQTTTQWPQLAVGDPPREERRTLPDHVLVHGRLAGGGALAVEVAGGRPADDTPFHLELRGEDGVLTLTGGAPRGFQAGLLSLTLDGAPVVVETPALPDSVVNVAGVYAALRDDVRDGTTTAPDVDDAVHLAHLVDEVMASSSAGGR